MTTFPEMNTGLARSVFRAVPLDPTFGFVATVVCPPELIVGVVPLMPPVPLTWPVAEETAKRARSNPEILFIPTPPL
jgi:hypothetical protein